MTTFFSYNALVSQRASGYRNTTYALAELIDNAFDANATRVRIILLESRQEGKRHVDEILVCDDGTGMSRTVLQGALQFGNTTNTNIDDIIAKRKKGKFGYGLPNASLSQCPAVHVFTWQNGGSVLSTYMDLEELKNTQSITIPEVRELELAPHYRGVGAQLEKNAGTIISWRRCDRLSNTRSETIINKSELVLGRLFRYLIASGKQIIFVRYEYNAGRQQFTQSEPELMVRQNDPSFLLANTAVASALWSDANKNWGATKVEFDPASYYKPFVKSEKESLPTNVKLEDKCYKYPFRWRGHTYAFEIQTAVVKLEIQKPGIREGGNTAVGQFYGNKTKEGNISFVRADREIASGHYGFYQQTEPRHRWWTIEVRFSPDADDLLGVHNNKQGIEFTYTDDSDPTEEWDESRAELLQAKEKLWFELTKRIHDARKAAWDLVRKQHREWDHKYAQPSQGGLGGAPGLPTGTQLTTNTQTQVDGLRASTFSDEQRKELLERLKQKYPSIPDQDISYAIDNFDQSKVRGCVLYAESESDQLWTYTTVYDFLIILINTRHEFYETALAPLRAAHQDPALASIELFISSLAWEEHNHFGRGHDKEVIENFRSYVGLHLNKYMRELQIEEKDFVRPTVEEPDTEPYGE